MPGPASIADKYPQGGWGNQISGAPFMVNSMAGGGPTLSADGGPGVRSNLASVLAGGGGDQAGYDAAMARYNETMRASGGAAMIAPPDRARFGLGPSYGPNGPVSGLGGSWGGVDPGRLAPAFPGDPAFQKPGGKPSIGYGGAGGGKPSIGYGGGLSSRAMWK